MRVEHLEIKQARQLTRASYRRRRLEIPTPDDDTAVIQPAFVLFVLR